jgi:hypothetical protein
MSKLRSMIPSRAMAVALLALFLNLSGLAYAATGGNLLLGKANTANRTTALTGTPASGAALSVTNSTAGLPAAAFHSSSAAQPFTVSSATKVTNLNADLLDGLDASALQSRSDLVRMDSVVNFGSTASWSIGPYITLYAQCSGSPGNSSFTLLLLNNTPSAGQWTSGNITSVAATNPATPEIHAGSAGSGLETQLSKETNPASSSFVGPFDWATVIWRDNTGEVVTATYTAATYQNYCQIVGTLTRAT